MSSVVLVPTAKLVPPELIAEFGEVPSCMLPIQGRSALHHVARQWMKLGFELVALAHDGVELVRGETLSLGPDVSVIDVGATRSLGETVLAGLGELDASAAQLAINFGDTFVGDLPAAADCACVAKTVDQYRWTVGRLAADGALEVVDKDEHKLGDGWAAFVGVFRFSQPGTFRGLLAARVSAHQRGQLDPFFLALVDYYDAVGRPSGFLAHVADWRDMGHIDTYYRSRRAFGSGARHFNDIEVDTARGIVTKRSADAPRLIDEISWYLRLPQQLMHVAPRVFDYSQDPERPFVEMEFYSYPPLNELYLYGACDIGAWARILDAVGTTLAQMGQVQFLPVRPEDAVAARRKMYLDKTRERLERVRSAEHLQAFWQPQVQINGEVCPGLPAVLDGLEGRLARAGVLGAEPLSVIHGDFCMSNILYDRRNAIIRVIDPRGRFGDLRGFGDPLYDAAKLSHSFLGSYDLLVAGQFTLESSADGIRLQPHLRDPQRAIQELFRKKLSEWRPGAWQKVRLVESLLFLSMVPLHSDRPASQQAFLAHGLRLYHSLDDGEG